MDETKKCRYCQSDIPKKAKFCPHCRKNQMNPVIGLVIMLTAFIFLGVCIYLSSKMFTPSIVETVQPSNNESYITLEQFNSVKIGMTYDDVVILFGCEGELASESDFMGLKTSIYSWYGSNIGANAQLTFQNGELMSKSQFGLK